MAVRAKTAKLHFKWMKRCQQTKIYGEKHEFPVFVYKSDKVVQTHVRVPVTVRNSAYVYYFSHNYLQCANCLFTRIYNFALCQRAL